MGDTLNESCRVVYTPRPASYINKLEALRKEVRRITLSLNGFNKNRFLSLTLFSLSPSYCNLAVRYVLAC